MHHHVIFADVLQRALVVAGAFALVIGPAMQAKAEMRESRELLEAWKNSGMTDAAKKILGDQLGVLEPLAFGPISREGLKAYWALLKALWALLKACGAVIKAILSGTPPDEAGREFRTQQKAVWRAQLKLLQALFPLNIIIAIKKQVEATQTAIAKWGTAVDGFLRALNPQQQQTGDERPTAAELETAVEIRAQLVKARNWAIVVLGALLVLAGSVIDLVRSL